VLSALPKCRVTSRIEDVVKFICEKKLPAYNIRRAITLVGVPKLIAAVRRLNTAGISLFLSRYSQNGPATRVRLPENAENRCSATVFGRFVVDLKGIEPSNLTDANRALSYSGKKMAQIKSQESH